MKNCKKCGVGINSLSKYGDICKTCNYKYIIAYQREKQTGCTPEMYNDLYLIQKGCCKICGKHASEFKRSLSADHCHDTKEVRGLLCSKCNLGLGYFNDDVVLLTSAISYLTKGN